MDANERVINRLERIYSLYGAGDRVDSIVSIGGHAYREDLRQAAYRFTNLHLKNDARLVTDSEEDLVTGTGSQRRHPIDPEQLRVFPKDADIPTDEWNTTIDRHFVPMARLRPPQAGQYPAWKEAILAELRRVTFRDLLREIPAASPLEEVGPNVVRIASEPGIAVHLRRISETVPKEKVKRLLLVVCGDEDTDKSTSWLSGLVLEQDSLYEIAPRGVGPTRWTRKNPPNYVERAHVLVGRTVDTGRLWDIIAAARYLQGQYPADTSLHICGKGSAGVLAVYAAVLAPEVGGVIVKELPASHMDPDAPQFLNVLRVCDIPDVLGMIAPRRLELHGCSRDISQRVSVIYAAAGASNVLVESSN